MNVVADRLTVDLPARRLRVLDQVSFEVADGERVALLGPSGAGKTTLLRALLGAVPARGTVRVGGHDPRGSPAEARRLRRATGVVRQGNDLVPGLSARLNAVLGTAWSWTPRDWWAVLCGQVPRGHGARLAELAARHGVADCLPARARELSGGQRQRIALVRALLPAPRLLLADEPTAGLDPTTAAAAVDALLGAGGATLVVATHDLEVARRFPRVLGLRAGRLVHDGDGLDEHAADDLYADAPQAGRPSRPGGRLAHRPPAPGASR